MKIIYASPIFFVNRKGRKGLRKEDKVIKKTLTH